MKETSANVKRLIYVQSVEWGRERQKKTKVVVEVRNVILNIETQYYAL